MSSDEVYLLGSLLKVFKPNKKPNKRCVLKKLLYYRTKKKYNIKDSVRKTAEALVNFYSCSDKKLFNIEDKIRRLHTNYATLRKSRNRITSVTQKNREARFMSSLLETFPIQVIAKSETEKDLTNAEPQPQSQSVQILSPMSSGVGSLRSEISEVSDKNDVNYVPYNEPKATPKRKLNTSFFSMINRLNLSIRKSFKTAKEALTSCTDIASFHLSISTIYRSRNKTIKSDAEAVRQQSLKGPLVLHWDSKIVFDKNRGKKVDRCVILVTGQDTEQLLQIPILTEGNAVSTTEAIMKTLNEWNISDKIVGLCFDTTSVNSGWRSGIGKRLEDKLQRQLLHFACHHHIYEIVVANLYKSTMGKSTGPDIDLFKRFKDKWDNLDKTRYRTYSDCKKLHDILSSLQIEHLLIFFSEYKANCSMPRADYGEMMELATALLEGTTDINFKRPGAFHRARWMAIIIYSIKIFMLSTTDETDETLFLVSKEEEEGLIKFIQSVIVSGYLECWYRSPIASASPRNDLQFLKALKNYASIEKVIGGEALSKFSNHLWYLNEFTVGLSFFDEEIETDEKVEMVRALRKTGSKDVHPRRSLPKRKRIDRLEITDFISKNTLRFFEIFDLPIGFLDKSPDTWCNNGEYLAAKSVVSGIKVVNDVAERNIAMMTDFKDTITKSEPRLQDLFLAVSDHRKNNK